MNWSMNLDDGSGSEAVKSSNGEGEAGSALVPKEKSMTLLCLIQTQIKTGYEFLPPFWITE
jgi:hypothetical protein